MQWGWFFPSHVAKNDIINRYNGKFVTTLLVSSSWEGGIIDYLNVYIFLIYRRLWRLSVKIKVISEMWIGNYDVT